MGPAVASCHDSSPRRRSGSKNASISDLPSSCSPVGGRVGAQHRPAGVGAWCAARRPVVAASQGLSVETRCQQGLDFDSSPSRFDEDAFRVAKTILKSQAVISKRARARAAGGMRSMPSGKEQGGWRPGKPWDKADGRRLMRPVGFVQAQHTGSCCCGAARGVLGRSEGGGIGRRLETQDKRGGFDRLRVQKAYQRGERRISPPHQEALP